MRIQFDQNLSVEIKPPNTDFKVDQCNCRHEIVNSYRLHVIIVLLPPANEVLGKVMFLHVSVIPFTGGGLASQHAS